MSKVLYESYVHNLAYQFRLSGDIVPWIRIYPHIRLLDDTIITSVPLVMTEISSSNQICEGDHIRLIVSDDSDENKWRFQIYRNKGSEGKPLILSEVCPACGEVLLPSIYGYGACHNKCCSGQISQNIYLFTSALGLVFTDNNKRILDALISRGTFSSLSDLFRIKDEDIMDIQGITLVEIYSFLKYIHSVRGNVTLTQLLHSLNIHNLSNNDINIIQDFFDKTKLPYKVLEQIIYDPRYKALPTDSIKEFFEYNSNRQLYRELCFILNQ